MLDPRTTVAQTVLDHSETAPVFQRHRIDYCCKGGRSIAAACEDRGIDQQAVVTELERAIAERKGDAGPDPTRMATPSLIALIVSRHHDYLRQTLPFVRALAAKVSRVHGDRDPRLRGLESIVVELGETLVPHLDAEEPVLFPALMAKTPDPVVVGAELEAMQVDHLAVGGLLEQLRDTTNDFHLPEWACTSYRTLFSELEQLEGDVLRHVHLENHVLMPRFR